MGSSWNLISSANAGQCTDKRLRELRGWDFRNVEEELEDGCIHSVSVEREELLWCWPRRAFRELLIGVTGLQTRLGKRSINSHAHALGRSANGVGARPQAFSRRYWQRPPRPRRRPRHPPRRPTQSSPHML